MDDEVTRSAPTLRQRLRYRLDNVLARGTWAVLVWLGVVTLLVVVISAFAVWVFGVSYTDDDGTTWLEDGWQSLLRVIDPGTMAADVGWGRRLLALAVTVFGILVAGTLIGVIAAGVEDRVDRMRRGRSEVIERDHVIVLGSSDRLPFVVRELTTAPRADRPDVIVVLTSRDPSDVHNEARALLAERSDVRLVVRCGDATVRSDVRLTRPADARAVIVLHEGGMTSTRTALALAGELGGQVEIPVVVEVGDAEVAEQLVRTLGPNVHPVVAGDAVARIAAYSLQQPGIGSVIGELIDAPRVGLHVVAMPTDRPGGVSFGDVVTRLSSVRAIGLITPAGLTLGPAASTTIGPDDRVVVVADGRPTESDLALGARGNGGRADAVDDPTPPPADARSDVLVIGWNSLGARIAAEWAGTDEHTPGVTIVADHASLATSPPDDVISDAIVDVDTLDAVEACRDHVSSGSRTTVILLARPGSEPEGDRDARTLLDLLAVRRHLEAAGVDHRLVVELLDPMSQELVDLRPGDDVISEAIGSRFLAQLALEPLRRDVLLAMGKSDGPSLRLASIDVLELGGAITVGDMVGAAYRRGWLAIGWRDANTGALELAPPLDVAVPNRPGLEVVLVA